MNIYLDNASTSFPKPKSVGDSIYNYIMNIGGNSGRSNHINSLQSNSIVYNTRKLIADFFNFDKPENVIFTNNITTSLNYIINGLLSPSDHVITSCMEHNSILRPLYKLNELGMELSIVSANNGIIDINEIKSNIRPNTKAIIISMCSNVTGTIQPILEIGKLCMQHNIHYILDTAQGAGCLNLDFKELNLSALAFTGHKGLLGPQGIGGFIISDSLNSECTATIVGGSGSLSHSLIQPDFLPDKFESGTLNIPGIVGINSGITYINEIGLNNIKEKSDYLTNKLISGLLKNPNVIIYGDTSLNNHCVSFNIEGIDTAELSFILDSDYGIKNRSGLHCAPLAHKSLGTFPNGTVRLSIGYFNTEDEIEYVINSINKIISIYK